MMRRLLLWYQMGIAISDSGTGILLLIAPLYTLHKLNLSAPDSSAIYLSWIGVFVASVGLACAYGARLMLCRGCSNRLETVRLLTAFTRGMVAAFLFAKIASANLPSGWCTVALFDGACACLQAIALRRGWLKHAFSE